MDNGTKAYMLNIWNDVFPCLISPLIIMFAAPRIRRKVAKFLPKVLICHEEE